MNFDLPLFLASKKVSQRMLFKRNVAGLNLPIHLGSATSGCNLCDAFKFYLCCESESDLKCSVFQGNGEILQKGVQQSAM